VALDNVKAEEDVKTTDGKIGCVFVGWLGVVDLHFALEIEMSHLVWDKSLKNVNQNIQFQLFCYRFFNFVILSITKKVGPIRKSRKKKVRLCRVARLLWLWLWLWRVLVESS
jgi:hypothetical protein